jgi:nitrite reductase (cytochrome c-552)
VHRIQDRTYEMRNLALDAVLDLTRAIGVAQRAGMHASRLDSARLYQLRAQFFTDFVEAENSMGFHADQEAARVLANAINYARLGHAALRGERATPPTRRPVPAQLVSPGEAPDRERGRGGNGQGSERR